MVGWAGGQAKCLLALCLVAIFIHSVLAEHNSTNGHKKTDPKHKHKTDHGHKDDLEHKGKQAHKKDHEHKKEHQHKGDQKHKEEHGEEYDEDDSDEVDKVGSAFKTKEQMKKGYTRPPSSSEEERARFEDQDYDLEAQNADEYHSDEWDATHPLPRSKILIEAYLKMHEVVPRIFKKAPKAALEVVYANSVVVDFGNILTWNQVDVMPHRTVWPVEDGARYTIILFSPDYPMKENPTLSDYIYWFVANVFDTCVTATGTTYADYLTPLAVSPNINTHRYIFVVYKQPKEIMQYDMPYVAGGQVHFRNMNDRKNFNVTRFASDHKLGDPVAANLFQMNTVRPNEAQKIKKTWKKPAT